MAGKNALLTVTDKRGLAEFARALADSDHELWASGGTRAALEEAGVAVKPVSDLTAFPEILGGRVKTLSPQVFGGVLGDPAVPGHEADLEAHGLPLFDVVVVNFYDFDSALAAGADPVEAIDVGGPALARAAAKNHRRVLVVTDPADYGEVAAALAEGPDESLRGRLAHKAFAATAAYDAAISGWLAPGSPDPLLAGSGPEPLRYGENPHQAAAVYALGVGALGDLEQIGGKALSYNNWLDLDAVWRLLAGLDGPGAAVVKHGNPTGLARGEGAAAMQAAWDGDPRAAFGGVVGVRPALTADAAEVLSGVFLEAVLAPAFDDAAVEVLSRKKNLRLVQAPLEGAPSWSARTLAGVSLRQEADPGCLPATEWSWHGPVPPPGTVADLELAQIAAKETRSNAISLTRDGALVGSGGGSTSRVGALEVALAVAGERARGAALASDAFFPFRDAIDLAADAGVAAIVQPGGSIRDEEVLAAAAELGIAMATTGRRHFLH